jgi:integrase/recombinase XerD
LKKPPLVLPTFTSAQVRLLVNFKPQGFYERRLHLMILCLFDVGARISEVLGLGVEDCDMDNLPVTLDGKGAKQRKVPFSFELRKVLVKYIDDFERQPHMLVLSTRRGYKLDRHIMLRDVKRLCEPLGFEAPARTLHAMRHTMASNFIKKNGSVAMLQRLLGHSDIQTTTVYVHLNTSDLTAAVQRTSLLVS